MKAILAVIVGMLIGNWLGDKQTALDCAKDGQAHLVSSVTIKCEVKK